MDLQEKGGRVAWRAAVVVVVATLVFALAGGQARAQYRIEDLGTLGGFETLPRAINESGQVAGTARVPDGTTHAFLWDAGHLVDLGELVTPASFAVAVDVFGSVTGNVDAERGATFWVNGRAFELSGASLNATSTRAFGANNRLQVAGSFSASGFWNPTAAVWSGGTLFPVGILLDRQGPSVARAIDDGGTIAGDFLDASGSPMGSYTIRLADPSSQRTLPSLGGAWCSVRALVGPGVVVGESWLADGTIRACLWLDGVATDLGTLGGDQSVAYDVSLSGNDRRIVGAAQNALLEWRAFLVQDEIMVDLNELIASGTGWELVGATAINDGGSIVGYGRLDGELGLRGFRLTPLETPCRVGSIDAQRQPSTIPIIELAGDEGDDHHRRFVRAGVPLQLFVDRARRVQGPRSEWALWIYEGESFACEPARLRARSGDVFTIGDANACLPIANSIAPESCTPRLADVLGVGSRGLTSKHLSAAAAARFLVSPIPAPPSPTILTVTFPPGTFTIYSVHEDLRSLNSPTLNLSVGNTIVVTAVER